MREAFEDSRANRQRDRVFWGDFQLFLDLDTEEDGKCRASGWMCSKGWDRYKEMERKLRGDTFFCGQGLAAELLPQGHFTCHANFTCSICSRPLQP